MLDYRMNTFLTLCETMNYRVAAQKLHITQPAVTQHIRYLEQYYGCKLFNYDGRNLRKTEEAVKLERSAHSMSYQEKKLKAELKPKSGNFLSIGATKTIGEFVIRNQVASYLSHPENHLLLDVDNTVHILSRLDTGELDFALIEGFFNRSMYGSILYRKEPFVGLCSKNHPFAGSKIPLDDIWKENVLLREKGSGTREILERLLEEHNHSVADFKRETCIGNFGLLRQLVANGCGITFAYAAVGEGHQELTQFTIEGWEVSREFNYVFLKDTGAENAVELFEKYR